jgi:hypothetical protein
VRRRGLHHGTQAAGARPALTAAAARRCGCGCGAGARGYGCGCGRGRGRCGRARAPAARRCGCGRAAAPCCGCGCGCDRPALPHAPGPCRRRRPPLGPPPLPLAPPLARAPHAGPLPPQGRAAAPPPPPCRRPRRRPRHLAGAALCLWPPRLQWAPGEMGKVSRAARQGARIKAPVRRPRKRDCRSLPRCYSSVPPLHARRSLGPAPPPEGPVTAPAAPSPPGGVLPIGLNAARERR